jgi:hypothetical protein
VATLVTRFAEARQKLATGKTADPIGDEDLSSASDADDGLGRGSSDD